MSTQAVTFHDRNQVSVIPNKRKSIPYKNAANSLSVD